jgi:hypothetical protein
MSDKLLSKEDLQQIFNCSHMTIARAMRAGTLPYIKIGSRVRFLPEVVARIEQEGLRTSPPAVAETSEAL